MTHINPYLAFGGNCREAMTFYHACLGGDLNIQTVGETPMADQMPEAKDQVMHAAIINDKIHLYASDMLKGGQVTQGNTISISLNCSSEEEIQSFFSKLSEGGTITQPLEKAFWGGTFGMFTDKFGFTWMLNYSEEK